MDFLKKNWKGLPCSVLPSPRPSWFWEKPLPVIGGPVFYAILLEYGKSHFFLKEKSGVPQAGHHILHLNRVLQYGSGSFWGFGLNLSDILQNREAVPSY